MGGHQKQNVHYIYNETCYQESQFSEGKLSAATYFRCVGRSYTIFICTSSENAEVKNY